MAENLMYELSTGKEALGSYNNGQTFSFMPSSCSGDNSYNCALNGNTVCNDESCWYSWNAATAGKGMQSSSTNIDGSICPAGWKLPYMMGGTRSFYNLFNSLYGTSEANALEFPLSYTHYRGGYSSGNHIWINEYGFFWSATPHGGAHQNYRVHAYGLCFYGGAVLTDYYNTKFLGYNVRCVST